MIFFGGGSKRNIYDYEDVHENDVYDKLEEQLVQLEERRRSEQVRLQSEQQRQAIQFQRAGFVHNKEGDATRNPPGQKRRRPSGWQ